jgi:TolA-binding protein
VQRASRASHTFYPFSPKTCTRPAFTLHAELARSGIPVAASIGMSRHSSTIAASVLILIFALSIPPADALEESDRLWFVGQRALADKLLAFGAATLDQFVTSHPEDARVPQALMMLGRARLTLGDKEAALAAFRRAHAASPPPGAPFEARYWEAEVLFQLKRYADARAAYDDVVRNNSTASFAPDARYAAAWTSIEMKQPGLAMTALQDLLDASPEHRLAPSATYHLGRLLVELENYDAAATVLAAFVAKHHDHKLVADARYLLGFARISAGDDKAGLADLKTFVSRHPAHALAADARKLITDVAVRVGDREDLKEAYTALMKETPATAEGLIAAASVAARLGRVRDQETAWKKLNAAFPDHPVTAKLAFDLANAAFTRKEWSLAGAFAQAAARTDDPVVKAEAWLLAGEAAMKVKHFTAAVKAFEAVGVVGDVDGALRYRALAELGVAREGQKNLRAALEAYEAVAEHSPDPALREWARERADALKARVEHTPAAPATKPGSRS